MKTLLPILRSLLQVKTLDKVDLRVAKSMYKNAREAYYNGGVSELTDLEYDALEDLLRVLAPGYSLLKKTGAKVGSKSEVALRVPMPSLSKIKIENESVLNKFLAAIFAQKSGTYVSAKIDGSSVEVVYDKGRLTRIVTRGDGTTGKNISHFIPHVASDTWALGGSGLPMVLDTSKTFVLRMEATIKKSVHEKKYAEEYASDRAMASAVFNRHDASPALKDIYFVLLSVVSPQKSSQAVDTFAAEHGFIRPVSASSDKTPATKEKLEALMTRFQRTSPYSLDGLVVGMHCGTEEITADLPKLTRSVKVDDHLNAPTTVITDIVWQPSSFGVLVPKAIIKPIMFGNVTVKQAALHNVKWAQDRGAGIGATVKVIRSGEIIPKIIEVTKPTTFEFPDSKVYGSYTFDGVRIVMEDVSSAIQSKKLQRMFSTLGLENLGSGFADKLVDAGFTGTREVLFLSKKEVQELPGVKTSAVKLYNELSRALKGEFTLVQLMDASGVFASGLGSTLLSTLATDYPPAFTSRDHLIKLCKRTDLVTASIGPARCKILQEGIGAFYDWSEGIPVKPFSLEKPICGVLSGKTFSWTGYRSEEEENFVKANGGSVVSFRSTTDVLFFRPSGKKSSKVEKAGHRALEFSTWKKKL